MNAELMNVWTPTGYAEHQEPGALRVTWMKRIQGTVARGLESHVFVTGVPYYTTSGTSRLGIVERSTHFPNGFGHGNFFFLMELTKRTFKKVDLDNRSADFIARVF